MLRRNYLIDFLNHGILPFTGREEELHKIQEFWQGTLEGYGLRGLLIVGEAGIGKSRLFEEASKRLAQQGGVVVHTKMYPDSSLSLAGLLADSLSLNPSASALLRKLPEPHIGDIVGALRRLSRLRGTLLAIEDVHLLEGEGLMEFSQLIDALADENLSLLCAARPVDKGGRSLLEPFLVETIELSGLQQDELRGLIQGTFAEEFGESTLSLLQETTLGNPLAIRSALRGVLKSKSEGQVWRNEDELRERFRLGSTRYTEGLAAHLSHRERESAAVLSWLGEVFDRQTAIALLKDLLMIEHPEPILDALRFKGIIASPATQVRSLSGKRGSLIPVAFTHSLFHRQMLGESEVKVDALMQVLYQRLPVYSVVPFQLLRDAKEIGGIEFNQLYDVLHYIDYLITRLTNSTDWKLSRVLFQAMTRIVEEREASLLEDESRRVKIQLSRAGISTTRSVRNSELVTHTHQLLALTESVDDIKTAEARLSALSSYFWIQRADSRVSDEIIEKAQAIIGAWPELQASSLYQAFLFNVAQDAISIARTVPERLADVEREWKRIYNESDGVLEEEKSFLLFLTYAYRTEDEFEQKKKEFLELDEMTGWKSVSINFVKLIWTYTAALPSWYLKRADKGIKRAKDTGTFGNEAHVHIEGLACEILLGLPLDEALERGEDLSRLNPVISSYGDARDRISPYAARLLTQCTLLRGEFRVAEKFFQMGKTPPDLLPLHSRSLLHLDTIENADSTDPLFDLFQAVERRDRKEIRNYSEQELRRPVLRYDDPLRLYATVDLLKSHDLLHTELESLAQESLIRVLSFFNYPERRLYHSMRGALNRYGWLFSSEEREEWEACVAHLEKEATVERHEIIEKEDQLIRLSMIGTISVHRPEEKEPTRLRGGRIKTLLGLLSLDAMLDTPLDAMEFNRIATEDDDLDKAKNAIKIAVYRAREVVGSDGIDVRDGRPWLNQERVRVDLLEAFALLQEGEMHLSKGSLGVARHNIQMVLDLVGEEVIFPGLYDRLFEAMRDEFESRLREATLRLIESLLLEGDVQGAEQLGRSALEAIPEDEELSDLLHRALMDQGRLAEAERLRSGRGE